MALGLDYECRRCGSSDFYLNSRQERCCRSCRTRRNKKYYEQNKLAILEKQAQYRKDHQDTRRIYKREEYARRKRAKGSGRVDYQKIWDRDKGVCYLCGSYVTLTAGHADHVRPLSKGGTHTEDNIRIVHDECNLRKGATWPLV